MLESHFSVGSWGTDLWPLCRVSSFNNQWSLRANIPFSLVFPIVFTVPSSHLPYIIKMFFLVLFLLFSLCSNCIQFSNLNRMCEWSGLRQKRKTELDWLECKRVDIWSGANWGVAKRDELFEMEMKGYELQPKKGWEGKFSWKM